MTRIKVAAMVAAFFALTNYPGVFTPASAQTQTYDVRIAHASPPTTSLHKGFERLKEVVEERSEGRLSVKIFHSGQLMGQRESVEGLQLGTVDIVGIPNGIAVTFAEEFMLLDIPFQFENLDSARAFIDAKAQSLVLDDLGSAGFVGLAIWEQGYRNLVTRDKPVETVEDLANLKIRTLPAPLHVLAWRSMGANPTPMEWSQVYTSLEQGVVDGLEVPTYLVTLSKLDEVVKYVTTTRHIYDPLPILGSKKWFDNLPEDLQEIVLTAMREITEENRNLNQKDVEEAEAMLPDRGVTLIEISPDERSRLAEMAKPPVIAEVRSRLGDEKVDAWLQAVEEAN